MKVIMIGGPYDNEYADVKGDEWNPPMPVLRMHPKIEPSTTVWTEPVDPKKTFDVLVYKLDKVVTSQHKWHYEYHYKGR